MKASGKMIQRISKTGLVTALIIGGMALAGCEKNDSDAQAAAENAQSLQYDMMQSEISARDSMIDELVSAFDKVDANLEVIREKERQVRELAEDEEASGDRKQRIIRDIEVINTLMADNRSEIARLRTRLKNSGVKVKGLEERLARMEADGLEKDLQLAELKQSLSEREQTIAGLTDTLGNRDTKVALQETIIHRQEDLILVKEDELNTAYFATGTYKELKERGLVEKKGALLGVIGGKKTYTAEAPEAEFIRIDQREHTNIPVFAKKAEIVTAHPAESYKFVKDDKGDVNAIQILDPDAFWESSRYLVVAVD